MGNVKFNTIIYIFEVHIAILMFIKRPFCLVFVYLMNEKLKIAGHRRPLNNLF